MWAAVAFEHKMHTTQEHKVYKRIKLKFSQ